MSSSDGTNFDWQQFEKFFGGPIPFMSDTVKKRTTQDFSWIEQYVNKVLERSIPQGNGGGGVNHTDAETFETHHHIIVKVNVPDDIPTRSIRVWAGMNQIKIEGLLRGNPQTITLPKMVDVASARALLKDGVLQIKLRKDSSNDLAQEVPIRFI